MSVFDGSPERARRTPEAVTQLADDEVFVFGSNASGHHGAGAARAAFEEFGAEWGVGVGPTGRSYAVDTMSGFDTMIEHIADFLDYARAHPGTTFLVTPVGTGIAGHRVADVAPLFAAAPANVVLPQAFAEELGAP
ncbi:hypothetical protein [Microbacterium sp. SORGH_AS_0862]|uniref:A1S_2505 family phage non-structural protein n=1 Tax=Microbacterium sp. SORGH_AS_0862 TaxID=3041789 RepID=UPI0027903FAB|nr:hypothetical protein [Microbacterium sp. SORGH_AS_0862]MDQ1204516.1 hypothetical protein [Microbacterium sp. SORGH_AS_0862]